MAFTPYAKHYITDGVKSIPLNALPKEAWTTISGGNDMGGGGDAVELARLVPFLRRCIEVRANSVAAVPWTIYRGDEPVWDSDSDEAPDELRWLEDLPEYIYLIESALCLMATAYFEKSRNMAGNRLSISWLAPQTMTPKWDKQQGLTHFERKTDSEQPDTMDVDDVLYIRLPNPMHETKPATAPAVTALAAAKVLNNVDKFAAVFFDRGAIKVTMLTVTGMPQQAERERLKSVWQRITNGIRGAFGAEVFNAESVKPVVIGDGIQELSNVTLTREKREDIATALGVPHAMVMSNETGAKATTQQDEIYFYTQTAIPECKLIQRQINKQLLAPLGLRLQFERERMGVFQENEEQRSMSVMHYVQAGYTPGMASEILGVALPDGVESYEELDTILGERKQRAAQQAAAMMQPAPAQDDNDDDGEDDLSVATRAALWRVEAKQYRKWVRKNPQRDTGEFVANYLTDEEKETIKSEVSADGDADDYTKAESVAMLQAAARILSRGE